MHDLADRLSNRVQLTTDGHRPYLEAVESAFGEDIDYARLVKIYGSDPETDKRYSPAKCLGCDVKTVTGNPNPKHVSTSYVERQNLTMRMSMRRFTRLTNAFSKKVEMHAHSVALHFMYYNFVKIHQSLRMTPAQAAGVTDRLWEVADLVELLEGSLMPDKGWIRKHDNDWESFVCEPEGLQRFIAFGVGGESVRSLGSHISLANAKNAADAEVASLGGHTCSENCGAWSN